MTGVALHLDAAEADAIARRMQAVMRIRPQEAAPMLGALVESQTRKRLAVDKRAPDGSPWPDWSAAYAATRRSGQSLLESEGHLIDSIESRAFGGEAEVGSALVYAAIQHAGGEDAGRPEIPARPFLGVGDDDIAAIDAAMTSVLDRQLAGALR